MRLHLMPALLLVGCASTRSSQPRDTTTAVAHHEAPRCRVRERVLAPVARHPRLATLVPVTSGLALVWTERVGEHDALRLLTVDAQGAPRSPSAEVVDRSVAVSAPALATDDTGFVVSWTEDKGRFERRVDEHGRPRTDVATSTSASIASDATPDLCTRGATKLVCTTPGGPLELPLDEQPLAHAPSGATVSLGPSGLRLWLLDCRN